VVIHVIHNGEAIGQGSNISEAQILSQLEVLNLDFKRLNTDAADTPPEFLPVAGAIDIEFVLAQLDPDGNPTNGINRVKGTKQKWSMSDNAQLKALSYWNANNYINIWVCNLDDYAGYTQFPISTLPGLENSPTNALTDGIVVLYRAFGSSDYGNFNLDNGLDKGRTATHEMGHFFGLRHIWGDVSHCDGTDYVDDTPPQSMSSSGCPSHPQLLCPSGNARAAMIQNYLDLTDDGCMNLFTKGQVVRMRTVLENSPRRASLLQSSQPVSGREIEKLFSPNGDGVNDYWKWKDYTKYTGCKVSVFNRFGKLVYEKSTYDGTWDGMSMNGEILEEEAYYYILSCAGSPDVTGGVRIVR
jgi:gliding motility-associated-like protein